MDVAFSQQLPSHRLAGATFKKDVIRHNNCCLPINLEDGFDVLEEVKLFVRRGCREILPFIDKRFLISLALTIDDSNAALFTKRRISEDRVIACTWVGNQGVTCLNRAFISANAVQIQIHHAQSDNAINNIFAAESIETQGFLLFYIKVEVVRHIIVCCQEKTTSATGWVMNGHFRLGFNNLNHCLNQWSRR